MFPVLMVLDLLIATPLVYGEMAACLPLYCAFVFIRNSTVGFAGLRFLAQKLNRGHWFTKSYSADSICRHWLAGQLLNLSTLVSLLQLATVSVFGHTSTITFSSSSIVHDKLSAGLSQPLLFAVALGVVAIAHLVSQKMLYQDLKWVPYLELTESAEGLGMPRITVCSTTVTSERSVGSSTFMRGADRWKPQFREMTEASVKQSKQALNNFLATAVNSRRGWYFFFEFTSMHYMP